MHSERPNHRMYVERHPIGIVGIISAFNFPVAVWSWNAMIAWVCVRRLYLEAIRENASLWYRLSANHPVST